MSSPLGVGISEVYAEEGENWLRVSPGHSVSERWLRERAPELYAQWWAAPSGTLRDQVALAIEERVDELETQPSWRAMLARVQKADTSAAGDLGQRVARYEAEAERLSGIGLDDPVRPSTHLAFQTAGDELREEIARERSPGDRMMLTRRLDAAELVADGPVIESMSRYRVEVGPLAAALAEPREQEPAVAHPDAIRAEMVADNPHAALRADVLTAVAAAGHDLDELREDVRRHGVDLDRAAPALLPASEFYARHAAAIDARLDREIATGGFPDLPTYMASWHHTRSASASLHDTERALVEHIVGEVIAETNHSDMRDAERTWQRATDRAAPREWSAALESVDLQLSVDLLDDGSDRQLELGLHVDDVALDNGHDMDQEAG